MRGPFEPRQDAPEPLSVEDRRWALAGARAFHDGDGEWAAQIYHRYAGQEHRLYAAMADLIGALVLEISDVAGILEDVLWTNFFEALDKPKNTFVRKRYRRNQE